MWGLALTKLDVLTGIDPLKICVAYEIRGQALRRDSAGRHLLGQGEAGLRGIPGWSEDITQARSLEELPRNARRYLERIARAQRREARDGRRRRRARSHDRDRKPFSGVTPAAISPGAQ